MDPPASIDPAPNRRAGDAVMVVAGLGVLAAAVAVVGSEGHVPDWEADAFDAVNGLPGWLYPVLWPFQQLGALVVGLAVAAVALVVGRWRLAVGALAVTVAKLLAERAVKAVVSRSRPATSIGGGVELRGDVPAVGESFVSGHAVLVAGLAGVLAPYLPRPWRAVAWGAVVAVMVTRVYVGAHNPLDVVGGAALGVAIAGAVNLALGVPPAGR